MRERGRDYEIEKDTERLNKRGREREREKEQEGVR